jgi:nicotinate-nucleotide adenylyltransferase
LGVLGGTFDPVHIGHLIIAAELKFAMELDRVLFVPAGDPPHKPDQTLTPAVNRVAMLELAIDRHHGFEVDRTDLDRIGPSYTKDTLTGLRSRFPGDDLVFLMGEDSLRDLHTWREPQRILELAEIGVGCRPDVDLELETVFEALPAARGHVTVVNIPLIGVSSRDLRRRVAAGAPIAYQVPAEVESYIAKHGLYRNLNGT